MAVVVGVPDPDVAAVFDYAGVGGGLNADRLEDAEGGLDLFAASTFMVTSTGRRGSATGRAKDLPTSMGCDEA